MPSPGSVAGTQAQSCPVPVHGSGLSPQSRPLAGCSVPVPGLSPDPPPKVVVRGVKIGKKWVSGKIARWQNIDRITRIEGRKG